MWLLSLTIDTAVCTARESTLIQRNKDIARHLSSACTLQHRWRAVQIAEVVRALELANIR